VSSRKLSTKHSKKAVTCLSVYNSVGDQSYCLCIARL